MSAAPKYDPLIGIAGLTMSADEYLALGEMPDRTELVHGVVVMSPSPIPLHQLVVSEINKQLALHADANPGVAVFPDTDVRFEDAIVYRPDLAVYAAGRLSGVPAALTEAPNLIVEVLSVGTRALDLVTKRDDYDRSGVGEYWAVDPSGGAVRCWRRQKDRLAEVPAHGDGLASAEISGFVLDLRPIRALGRAK